MFYETRHHHGLPHDPFKGCVVPRCIGWISTMSRTGTTNLAPYSFFNGVSANPPMVMFASGGQRKDSLANVEATGEFVCNLATWELREQMNLTSADAGPEVDEFELAGLDREPSVLVKPPRVKDAPIHLECRHYTTVELPCGPGVQHNAVVIGEVVGIHIRDSVLTDGMVDMRKFRPIARLGYMDYTIADEVFTMLRPVEGEY